MASGISPAGLEAPGSGAPGSETPGSDDDLALGTYVPYLLHQAHRALLATFADDLARTGIALAEWRVLSVLQHQGSLRFGALAQASGLEPPTLVRVLAGLERRTLAERRPCARDRRSTLVHPTAAGLALAAGLVPAARRLEEMALAGLTAREVGTLRRLLARLSANAQAGRKKPRGGRA